jgi:hypothetical protein
MPTLPFSSATISVLLLALLLSACQPVQPDPAAVSQIQPAETVTDQKNGSSHVVPQAVRDLAGNYAGSWTVFGIDEAGQVVKLVSWTDTIQAEHPQIDGEQAYVLTTGEMVFDNGNIPPMKIAGKEGYFLLPDGTLGDYFVETNGQVSKSHQLSENVWISVTPASAQDLASYRLPNVSSGQHILNKVVTGEEGVEIHRITRVTTVNWTDQAGQERSTQFVSLQGFHRRQAE